MVEHTKTILDAKAVEDTSFDNETTKQSEEETPKKKSRLKFHLILMLILGVGTWAFVTYSSTAESWKQAWYDFTHQPVTQPSQPQTQSFKPNMPNPTAALVNEPVQTDETTLETIAEDMPFFTDAVEPEPIAQPSVIDAESMTDISSLLEDVQQQMLIMQENINQMFNQQFEQNKQRISAQMYALLAQASSANADISKAAAAWKSISLLPMLDEERRAQAEQAWLELKGLNQDTQTLRQEVVTHIQTLAEKLHPEALAEVAQDLETVSEANNIDQSAWMTWVDWLKTQFQLRKIEQYALDLTQDPYADLKALISELDALATALQQGQWESLPDMESLAYQLEQYGISTSLSAELLDHIQQTQQAWKQQAKAWMEQL